ncbi:MAG: hypothetical protein JWN67_1102 [Actinomycetia bacterium]|nr:hypothetical protein [Actinomycetes bacterium]
MRLSDLLGSPVTTADGEALGRVQDVRLVQDGPYVEGFGQALRVEGVVTGKGTLAVRLGFARAGVQGPWPLTTIFRRLERRARYYTWDEVDTWDEGGVRLVAGAAASEPV